MTESTVPQTRIRAEIRPDGSGILDVNGTQRHLEPAGFPQTRTAIVSHAAEFAQALRRAIGVSITGADGGWDIVVHPDGSVSDVRQLSPAPTTPPPPAPAASASPAASPADRPASASAPSAPSFGQTGPAPSVVAPSLTPERDAGGTSGSHAQELPATHAQPEPAAPVSSPALPQTEDGVDGPSFDDTISTTHVPDAAPSSPTLPLQAPAPVATPVDGAPVGAAPVAPISTVPGAASQSEPDLDETVARAPRHDDARAVPPIQSVPSAPVGHAPASGSAAFAAPSAVAPIASVPAASAPDASASAAPVPPPSGAYSAPALSGPPYAPGQSYTPGQAYSPGREHAPGLAGTSGQVAAPGPLASPDQVAGAASYAPGQQVGGPTDERHSFLEGAQRELPAQQGMRGAMTRIGLKMAPSPEEAAERADERAVSQHWPGPRTIAVVNGKGGAGKTPTTVLLSAVFAHFGGAGVLAWDNNQTRGTLGWRTERGQHESTLLELLPQTDRLLSIGAQAADLASFVHHQSQDKYDVLRSKPMRLAQENRLDPDDVDAIHAVASKYYRLIVIDSGNDESDPMWLRMIDHADQIVVATTTRADHAEAGALLLEALAQRDERSARLAQRSVVVVSQADPKASKQDVDGVFGGYGPLAREVVRIPFDQSMVDGHLRLGSLRSETRRAWLGAAAAVARGL